MTAKTENHQINTDLTLHDSSQSPLTVRAITLTLTTQNNELIACRLTFQVNPQIYQRIDTAALFNLKPDVRNIQRVVYANVTMMDEYLPGILSVIYGNLSAQEAIAKIED